MKETAEELRKELKLCIYHPVLKKHFEEYTKSISADELVLFVRDVDDFRILLDEEPRKEKFQYIMRTYLRDDAVHAVHMDAHLKEHLQGKDAHPSPLDFDECQESVFILMQSDIYPKFVKSQNYKNFTEEISTLPQKEQMLQNFHACVPRLLDVKITQGRNLLSKGKPIDNIQVKIKLFGLLDLVEDLGSLQEEMRVELGRRETKVIKKTGDPVWNEEFVFVVEPQHTIPYLICDVVSKDSFFQKKVLGTIMISVAEVDLLVDRWIGIKKSGEIQISMKKRM
eukprot:TRINITY_DN2657_c0_g1_i5.p1 TRINITY_DN2657_c0_g1~~TRINITY_DN2657_c0_g1_i5.p1  ORF type:complete len:282 (+),score=70.11 TRINITY_DN2657_c0_g1_i5:98-943(+)